MSAFDALNILAKEASRTLENDRKWSIRNRSSSFDSSPASSAKTVSPGYINTPTPQNNDYGSAIARLNGTPSQSSDEPIVVLSSKTLSPSPSSSPGDDVTEITTTMQNVRLNNTLYEYLCFYLSIFLLSLQLVTVKVTNKGKEILLIASKTVFAIIFKSLNAILVLIGKIITQEAKKVFNSTFFRFTAFVFLYLLSTEWGRNTLYTAYCTIAHIFNYKELYGAVGSAIGTLAMIKNVFQGIPTHQATQTQFNRALQNHITTLQNQNAQLLQQVSQLSQVQTEYGDSIIKLEQGQTELYNQIGINNLEQLEFTDSELQEIKNSQKRIEDYFAVGNENKNRVLDQLNNQLKVLFKLTEEGFENNQDNFNKIMENQHLIASNIRSLDTGNAKLLEELIHNSADTQALLQKMEHTKYTDLMKAIIGNTNLSVNDITGYLTYFQQYIHFGPGQMNARLNARSNARLQGGKRKTRARKYKKKAPLKKNTKRMQFKKKKQSRKKK
jgi:hypothetical protein